MATVIFGVQISSREKNEEVQNVLFKYNIIWSGSNNKVVHNLEAKELQIWGDECITWSTNSWITTKNLKIPIYEDIKFLKNVEGFLIKHGF